MRPPGATTIARPQRARAAPILREMAHMFFTCTRFTALAPPPWLAARPVLVGLDGEYLGGHRFIYECGGGGGYSDEPDPHKPNLSGDTGSMPASAAIAAASASLAAGAAHPAAYRCAGRAGVDA